MAENVKAEKADEAGEDMRGQLLKRLAVAGVLVAVLLAVLAFFDYLANNAVDDEGPVFTQPVPVAPKKEVSQPVKPADDLPPPPVQETATTPEPRNDAPPAPVVEAAPAEPPRPGKTEEARFPARVERSPAVRQAAPAVASPAARPVAVVREETAPPGVPLSREPVPTARVLETTPAAQPAQPQVLLPRLASGFLLQAGVFSSPKSAEELHAKLTLSGVPSTLETRVQVGPFKTRQEAEAAQQKLKAIGIDSVLVPPKGR